MAIQVMDLIEKAHKDKKREVVMNTKRFHSWVHVYPEPGNRDDMHCHNADQSFYVIEGECTMHFPDGGKAVMKPGMAALIHGGDFYQLENTGTGPMILMGNRSGPSETSSTSTTSSGKTSRSCPGKTASASARAARCT